MLRKLRRRLTLSYTFFIWIVLTIILGTVLYMNERSLQNNSMQAFQSQLNTIILKLRTENTVNRSWLVQMETANSNILHIEENGHDFFFPGVWTPPTPRHKLIAAAKNAALAEGLDTDAYPLFSEAKNSTVFTIQGDQKEVYYGSVLIIPKNKGWLSVVYIRYAPQETMQLWKNRLYFGLIDIFSLLVLFSINWIFIGKSLKPVEISRKKQTAFVAAASHELRSPLAVVLANASAIENDAADNIKYIHGIKSECKRMGRLIDDMLVLASADAGSWTMHKELIDMDTLLIEIYDAFLPLCQQKQITLSLHLPDDTLPPILGDTQRLQQVLMILLDNAVNYTPSKQQITITAKKKGMNLAINIADTGIGIPDQLKPHIFDRFYQIDSSRNKKEHFGLGLSIALELVQMHHGCISCKNTPGGGTTFTVSLPAT